MKITKLYLIIVSLIALLASNAIAAAWTGSMSEPENMKKIDGKSFYVITTADELAWFAAQVNGGKTTINAVLGNDIVFGMNTSSRSGKAWTPIGSDDNHVFNGTIDGAGYTIYGLVSGNRKYTGLVGVLGAQGELKKISLQSGSHEKTVALKKDTLFFSSIVSKNYGKISGCKSADTIFIKGFSGDHSFGSGTDYTNWIIGSIAAINNGGYIYDSKNTGLLKFEANYGSPYITSGGITGVNKGVIQGGENYQKIKIKINYSLTHIVFTANSQITYEGRFVYGGITGLNAKDSKIVRCKNNGVVNIESQMNYNTIGGIAGLSSNSTIENCINNSLPILIPIGDVPKISTGEITASSKATILTSYCSKSLKYWIKNTEVQGTAENMQKDQFAWILNTANGTETNSGVWTRTTGYPDFAKDSNLPIYRVVFNDDGATSNRYTNYKGLATFPENPEPAEGLVFMGWYNSEDVRVKPTTVFSSDQTVNAVYMNATDIYWTINFFNTDVNSTLLETKQYQHGSIVAYEGETPTKETTAKYTYTFKGWNVEPTNAVEDFDYYAVYDSTIRSYMITFKDYDGSEISSGAFEYGSIPSCSKTPSRTATAKWTYAHKGWKPALDYVTESTAYTATYDSTKVEYKVTFMNGVDIIDEQMVPYGDAAVAPTNVTREGYRFTGWNTSFSNVTENLTVKALFEELATYIVKVLDSDGTKIDSVKIVEGESYTLPTAPKKDGYTFDAYYNGKTMLGIAGDAIPVVANITITAVYTKDPESSSRSVVKSSSSSAKSSSSSVPKSSSSLPKEVVISGKLEQTLGVYDWMDLIIFSGVQNYSRESYNIPFLEITKSGTDLTIRGTVPGTYRDLVCNGDKKTDSLKVNWRIYKIELTIKNPNKPCNSALTLVSAKKQFSVKTYNRNLLISGAKVGESYAIFDLQGRILKKGRVESVNFNIPVTLAGNYVAKIGHITQLVQIR